MIVLMLSVRREYAPIPVLIIAIYVTLGQVIEIFGLHFTMFRVLVLFGWVRLVMRGEIHIRKFNAIDKCIILWVVSSVAAYTIQRGSFEALVNRLGLAYNAIGLYFLFRCLIRDMSDLNRVLKVVCLAVVPLTAAMVFEWATGYNVFSVFGGVSATSLLREDRVRCQGSFAHAIMAGTFGATMMPLLAALWFQRGIKKWLPMVGVTCVTLVMVLAHSSGPVTAYVAILISFACWPLRYHMRAVTWGLALGLFSIHMIMKAPVWALIGRLSNLVGGDGWHRTELIDSTIQNFGQWWLVGTWYTAHWLPFSNLVEPGMADITNQYVLQGVDGGLVTLVLFVAVIVLCFRAIGRMFQSTEALSDRIMVWATGAALVGHVMSFFSVSYFDQLIVFWYFLLATISSLSSSSHLKVTQQSPGSGI